MSNTDTPVSPDTIVRELSNQLQAMGSSIDGLVFLPIPMLRRLTPAASVPDKFFEAVADAVEQAPALHGSSRLEAAEYRHVIAFSLAFGRFAAQLEQFARGIRDMILARRSETGQEALRMYSVAQSFNRPADHEQLIPHIAAMREALGRGRPRSNNQDEPPATPGAPAGGNNTGGPSPGNGSPAGNPNGNGGPK